MAWRNRSILFRDPDGNRVSLFASVTEHAIDRFNGRARPTPPQLYHEKDPWTIRCIGYHRLTHGMSVTLNAVYKPIGSFARNQKEVAEQRTS